MSSKTWVWVCIAGIAIFSILGIISYFTEIEWLSSLGHRYIPMAPLTAINFMIVTFVLVILNHLQLSKYISVSIVLIAVFLILEGTIMTIDYLFLEKIDFEDYFFKQTVNDQNIKEFRMSPVTSILFILSGLDIIFFNLVRRSEKVSGLIVYGEGFINLFIIVISYIFSLAYLYGKPMLYSEVKIIPIAVTTALGFLFFAIAMLILNRDYSLIKFFLKSNTHSMLLKFILPLTLLPIFIIQLSLLFSFRNVDVFSVIITSTISVIVAVITGFIVTFITQHLSKIIDQQNRMILESEKTLVASEEKYRNLFYTMAQGVAYQDIEGRIVEVNPAAEKLLGLTFDQMQGRSSFDPRWRSTDIDGNDLPGDRHPAIQALKNGTEVSNFIMGIYNPKIEKQVWIIVNSIPLFRTGEEKPWQVCTTFLDITDLKNLNDEKQQLKEIFENQVKEKTSELNQQIKELEHYFQVTVDREIRMEELRKEIELLKKTVK